MKRLSATSFYIIGALAVFLVLVSVWFNWEWFKDLLTNQATAAWIQAIGSIGAIIATAWVVQRQHALQEQARSAEQEAARVDAVNGVLLILMRQLNLLLTYRKQILEPFRADPARHFALPPTLPIGSSLLQVDWRLFSYLSRPIASDALMQLILAHDAFHAACDALNERNRLHREELQPRVEGSGLNMTTGAPESAVSAAVGVRLTHTLKVATDSVFDLVDLAINHLTDAGSAAPIAIRRMFPGHQINGFGPAPQPPTGGAK